MSVSDIYRRILFRETREQSERAAIVEALYKVQGVIEFDLSGRIISANSVFLDVIGYTLAEIQGQHHSIFVEASFRQSEEYEQFWTRLRAGIHDARRYKRLAKGGREVWIQASYNPLLDSDGKPYKIIKFATDVTDQVNAALALDAAVQETQATIQATLSGSSDRRITTSGKTGQLAAFASGVNGLIDNILATINAAQVVAKSAADGDLDRRIALEGKHGHFLSLSTSINTLIANMASVVSDIGVHADTVNSSAEAILRGNANLSEHTESQAANLEETASSMEQMTSSVRQNASHAAEANRLVGLTRDEAVSGQVVLTEAVGAMKDISSASSRIADIIGVIDEIAFQTNLLALNAAVEAARAGEQGRGFAVVANEVRSLASRCAIAAKEIKSLIQDSVSKIAMGSTLVDRSGETLSSIVTSVKKVTDIVGEIAVASGEQAHGIELVNKAVSKLDNMTQQNAALVEEGAAAAQSMMEQSRQLTELMQRYTVTRDDKARPAVTLLKSPVRAVAREARAH
jgi:methyl-accepting chemotaxis protein